MMNLLDIAPRPPRPHDIDSTGSILPWVLLALVLVGTIILFFMRKRDWKKLN
ncbi:MAG: hypothetical protein IKN83_10720 [Bacteroidaceae bacterium]|nr:hypothetical protein [Bacteroidaceae bacterium]MBR3531827.1 hypothetical protein [Bacteroidaceae bacterium]